MGIYKCKDCGSPYESKKEIKAFKCKSCGKVQKTEATIIIPPVISLTEPLSEEKKDIEFKVESVTATLPPKTPEIIAQTEAQKKVEEAKKGFVPETVTKYFEVIDGMMKKKATAEVWDVTTEEEKLLGSLWSDYANEKFKNVNQTQSKLVVAGASTFAVYIPRVIEYAKKIMEKKKAKKKTEEKTEEEIIETNTQATQVSKEGWENKRLPQG
jgi:hypothetical protein